MRDDWGIVRGIVSALLYALLSWPSTGSAQVCRAFRNRRSGLRRVTGFRKTSTSCRGLRRAWCTTTTCFSLLADLRQEDVFLRVTPGLQASYQSTPFTIVGNYRFDSEVYSKFHELNSADPTPIRHHRTTMHVRHRVWTVGGHALAMHRPTLRMN